MSDFQGIEIKTQRKDTSFGIAKLPNRKKVSLYRKKDGNISPLAFFTKEEHADEFISWIEELVHRVNSLS